MVIENNAFIFIVGSPRSGTTILGEILNGHRLISQWYEPYFVWDKYFRDHPHDERKAADAVDTVRTQIRSDFQRYQKDSGSRFIVDKSPRNSLKIPFIRKIFPEARFIHILRDGRDVTLSIHKEWTRRRRVVSHPEKSGRFDHRKAYAVIMAWLARQPFARDKARALWFETHGHVIDRSAHLNRRRWNGEIGWGPRFNGWQEKYKALPLLVFNACQWLSCVESVQQHWKAIPDQNKIEIRYEDMIRNGRDITAEILDFIGLKADPGFLDAMPELKRNNFNKWQKALSANQVAQIHSAIGLKLTELGYKR